LTGSWGERGVGLTTYQFDFARKQRDKWWLFVVENYNKNERVIYQIPNPVIEANIFNIDCSWKKLAKKNEIKGIEPPHQGDVYKIESSLHTVVEVKKKGTLYLLTLDCNGKRSYKKYKPNWEKVECQK
jgi:hypothetical protein